MGFDTEWKQTTPGKVFEPASSLDASHPSPLRREPFARAARSQDSVVANGRRLLVSQHMGGCDEWLVDNVATGGGSQTKPEDDVWRTACRARTEMMPGVVLVARVLAVPSGATVYEVSGLWPNDGNGGACRFTIDYANTDANTDSKTVHFELPPSAEADGVEDSMAGAAWSQLQHHVAPIVRPQASVNSPTQAAKWAEWPTITVQVEHRGGARVVHASLCEEAYEHYVAHDDTDTTYNGTRLNAPPNMIEDYPVEKTANGVTYDDERFGTHQLLRVANRQTQRVGPRICHWSAYSEELTEVTDTEADALAFTNTADWKRVSWTDANANTTWDADAPGFDITATRRNPENLSSRLSGAAVSPVRLRAYCRFSAAGANTGYLKIQTSPRSWVTLTISQADVGDTWSWRTITGFVETNIASDDTYCIVQDFAKVTGGQLEIRYWDLSYGDFATGA